MGFMKIPRKVDYAIRAAIYLAAQDPEKKCSTGEIAENQGIPRKFLEKIIQNLTRSGLVKSKRGSDGGYSLARPTHEISLRDIIEAVEGPISLNVLMDEQSTRLGVWSEVQRKLVDTFACTTLADAKLTSPRPLSSASLSSAA